MVCSLLVVVSVIVSRDFPDQADFPGHRTLRDAANYIRDSRGRQMQSNSLNFRSDMGQLPPSPVQKPKIVCLGPSHTPRSLAGKWREPGKRLYLGSTSVARAENAGRAFGPEGTLGSGPAVPGPRGAGKLLRPVGLDAGPAVPGRRFRRVLLP